MVSFVCDACQETLKKPKLDVHAAKCRGAAFTCIDCYTSFQGVDYRRHFSCISEVEKYEKKCKPVQAHKITSKSSSPPTKPNSETVIIHNIKTETKKKSSKKQEKSLNSLFDHFLASNKEFTLANLLKTLKSHKIKKSEIKSKILTKIKFKLDSKQKPKVSFDY